METRKINLTNPPTLYLKNRAAGEGFDCPYQGCSAFLGSAEHLLNHTQRQHGLRL